MDKEKHLTEMRILEYQLNKAIRVLQSDAISFEFDDDLDISEIYFDHYPSLNMIQIYDNAVSSLEEIRMAITSAIKEL